MRIWFTFLLIGCGGKESTGAWLERTAFDWVGANHRLTHYEMGVSNEDVYASMVGGTSTTGLFHPLPTGCEQQNCDEFPIRDRAEVEVGWARVTSKTAVFATGTASLLVDSTDVETTIEIPLPHRAKGQANALLQGFSFDTNQPLTGGDACYRPANGWLPKRMGLKLGEATLSADGMSVQVPVSGHFQAGATFEDARACLDAVVDQAQIALRVDVLAVVSQADFEVKTFEQELAYAYTGTPFEPGEQPDPDFSMRPLGSSFETPLAGWSAFDFTFHEVGQDRGAYLRTVVLDISGSDDLAYGHATNHSPGTQLSGFDYVFSGTAVAIDLHDAIKRGLISETIEVEIQDDGSPMRYRFPVE